MKTEIRKLKSKLVERGETQDSMARQLNLTAGTVSRKMRDGGQDFTVAQIQNLAQWLSLSGDEVRAIFFAD